MRKVFTTKQFKKDFKKLLKSGRFDLEKLRMVMKLIEAETVLEAKYKDHPLRGEWKRCRDCHIEGDWVLIYEIQADDNGEIVIFHRTGNHANLFQ